MKSATWLAAAAVCGALIGAGCCCPGGKGRPGGGGQRLNNWHAYMDSYIKPEQYLVVATHGTPGQAPYGYELLCTFAKPAYQFKSWIMVDSEGGDARKATRGAVRLVSLAHGADPLDELLEYGPGGDFEVEDGTVYISTEVVKTQSGAESGSAIVPRPWPVLVTRYLGVGAEASRFIVQMGVDGDPERERVICCQPDGGPIVVGIALESEPYYGSPVERINAGEYVEFKKGGKLVRGVWVEGDEIGQVVKSVLEHAESLGVP